MHTFGFNIWVYFSSSCFKGYEDGEHGFYQVYREVFERIKTEERKAFNNLSEEQGDQRKLEGFGDSTTSIDNVLRFYDDWNNFTTYKTFVWIEEWDTKEAPNRYVRREMEK
jgi:DnaJ family protein A protein 5